MSLDIEKFFEKQGGIVQEDGSIVFEIEPQEVDPNSLYAWVCANNPDTSLNYYKGWWDWIEYLYMLEERFNIIFSVVGEYQMDTPPPTETLTFPIVKCNYNGYDITIKEYFSYSGFVDTIIIGVISDDMTCEPSRWLKAGLVNAYEKHLKASSDLKKGLVGSICTVGDVYDLYAFLKMLNKI